MAKRIQSGKDKYRSRDTDAGQQAGDPPDGPKVITINSHRALAAKTKEIVSRLEQNPEIGALFLVNPVLAFRDLGVEMSSEMSHHVLHTIRHSPALSVRRKALEARLADELGEVARPLEPAWLSDVLFERLQILPLGTRGLKPVYRDPIDAETRARFEKRRPAPRGNRYPERQVRKGPTLRVIRKPEALRRMDLDADLPTLKKSRNRPKTVSLQTLYFYKDSHPLARDLLELGIIQKMAYPTQSGDSYRKIKEGRKQSDFRSWIRSVKFKSGKRDE